MQCNSNFFLLIKLKIIISFFSIKESSIITLTANTTTSISNKKHRYTWIICFRINIIIRINKSNIFAWSYCYALIANCCHPIWGWVIIFIRVSLEAYSIKIWSEPSVEPSLTQMISKFLYVWLIILFKHQIKYFLTL